MLQFKIMAILLVALVAGGFYLKHLLYQRGVDAANLAHAAKAAERSIEAERRAGASLAEATKAGAEGDGIVADLRRRAENHAAAAKAARMEAEALRRTKAPTSCPKLPETKICPSDLPLLQP